MPDTAAWRSLLSVAVVAALIALALGVTHEVTRKAIAHNEQRAWLTTIRTVTGDDTVSWPVGQRDVPEHWSICDTDGKARHELRTVRTRGYGGEIRLLIGFSANGRVQGLDVLNHSETPGLGDVIEPGKSDWLQQFQGLTRQSAAGPAGRLRRDGGSIDTLTGATITSRAVVEAMVASVSDFTPGVCGG